MRVDVGGNELRSARIIPIEVLNDDGRFRDGLVPRVVDQNRKLAYRPQF
jgi:hypothetical protein